MASRHWLCHTAREGCRDDAELATSWGIRGSPSNRQLEAVPGSRSGCQQPQSAHVMGALPDILLGCRLPQQPLFASSIRRKVIWRGGDARFVFSSSLAAGKKKVFRRQQRLTPTTE